MSDYIRHRVKEVKPLPNYMLEVTFISNERKFYNISLLLNKWKIFMLLKQIPKLFEQVHIVCKGYAVAWNDDIDLDCNELYYNGKNIGAMVDI
ncbi:MAG: DUF2442 domain-containing protein [Mucispirillum sp.]|nr:DUF2442 domain-containing protein [Mucispirillum sp.]